MFRFSGCRWVRHRVVGSGRPDRGTIGTRVRKYVASEIMEPALGVVFGVVGVTVAASERLA